MENGANNNETEERGRKSRESIAITNSALLLFGEEKKRARSLIAVKTMLLKGHFTFREYTHRAQATVIDQNSK